MYLLTFDNFTLVVGVAFLLLGGRVFGELTLRGKVLFIVGVIGLSALNIVSIIQCGDGAFEMFIKSLGSGKLCNGVITFMDVLKAAGLMIGTMVSAWLIGRLAWIVYDWGLLEEPVELLLDGLAGVIMLIWHIFSTLSIWLFTCLYALLILLPYAILETIWEAWQRRAAYRSWKTCAYQRSWRRDFGEEGWAWKTQRRHWAFNLCLAIFWVSLTPMGAAFWVQGGKHVIIQVQKAVLPPERFAQRHFACETYDGAPGVLFVEECQPLDLKELDLSFAAVSDLTPLAGLTKLERLYLTGAQARDLTPLSGLTELRQLFLTETEVIDLTPLANLTGLHFLWAPDGTWHGSSSDTPAARAAVAQAIRESGRE